ncbi:glutathione transferase omega-1 [Coprinopsis cinerea AmutBmut pab1-1]|nr:glutathione transferase omega-1 [Coprinopsis cinerea AmutBmut pab1-1]
MNSYPPELLVQLAPVMFVAGLDVPPPPPPDAEGNASKPDPFQVLAIRLREALTNQRKVAIWQSDKSKTFQVILVDKDVRFPPRKLVPPDDPQYSNAHSPLSPLTPSSPLYPDGLIAPIWIRKHTTLVPSVLVMFMRIFELPPPILRSPEDGPELERERAEEERRRDAELAAEIAQRKRGTNERGVKLTVVLMASRRLLDDPKLDARLAFIRRQSGLDSRAALFVLSPVSPSELGDFVKSLQQALYEPALEYYTAHSKRVRRKRNRHSQATTYTNPAIALANPNVARPLRPEGWTVRYEYKMACFAEFRGEDEVALKHYQDAYSALIIMFGSTAILPPRTKRWAEAKVLADCINIKIVKLYLYNNEHALALAHHNTHIRQFNDLSRGWGIGEETFEFWGWVARQYRILAELIDQGTRSGLLIPVHKPVAPPNPATAATRAAMGVAELDALRSLGINPSHALQHSGYYYYMAAKATDMRRERFLAAVEAENNNQPITISPGFANEKKVDHLSLVLELYTKAYEMFKRYNPPSQGQSPGRLTMLIAYRIAEIYALSGKYDMAIRFLERIAKTYRKEGWYLMLRPLLAKWYHCAQQMPDVNLSIKLLLEMMGHEPAEDDEPTSLQEDLLAVLQSTVPTSDDEVLVYDFEDTLPIFETSVAFWDTEVHVSQPAAFQLSLSAPPRVVVSSLPITSMEVHFLGLNEPLVVRHDDSEEVVTRPTRVDLGNIKVGDETPSEVSGHLRWGPGSTVVFTGTVSAERPSRLTVEKVLLNLEQNKWKIQMPLSLNMSRTSSRIQPRWLRSLDPPRFIPVNRQEFSFAIVKHRPHLVDVSISHHTPSYLDEDYEIHIQVTNRDEKELDVTVDILLQPSDIDYAVNSISIDDQVSTGLIKDIQLGKLLPGMTASKILHLFSAGAVGDRALDISVTSSAIVLSEESSDEEDAEESEEPPSPTSLDKTAHQRTVIIPTIAPFDISDNVVYARTRKEWPALADLSTFHEEGISAHEASISLQCICTGPWGIFVESAAVEIDKSNSRFKLLDSSIDIEDCNLYPGEYLPGDEFSISCRLALIKSDLVSENQPIPSPGKFILSWRR